MPLARWRSLSLLALAAATVRASGLFTDAAGNIEKAEAKEEEKEEPSVGRLEVYRPWASRYDLKPADKDTAQPEFRKGYRRFEEANPQHALTPNSADRDAESAAILVFALAGLSSVLAAGIAADRLQGARPEEQILGVAVCLAVPWAFAAGWLMHVALRHAEHPTRGPGLGQQWQCDASVWYLLLAPLLTTLAVASQALGLYVEWLDEAEPAPMGRMLPAAASRRGPWDVPACRPGPVYMLTLFRPLPRHLLLSLEVAATTWGAMLAVLGEHICEPELWWSLVALVTATSAALLVAPMAIGCGLGAWRTMACEKADDEGLDGLF
mmetsp:Transcript_99068/g.212227  ORF Transcript_99068/g.212227 Transcript_99068/m.212227 type:complete len:324 (-) Transcript_99068:76-1047(-)